MNPQNIEPYKFPPGQSGNPAGRPVGSKNLSTILRDMLEEEIEVSVDQATGRKERRKFSELIIRKLIKRASDGDPRAIKEIFDRIEGRAKQSVDVTTDGKPLNDEVDYTKLSDNVLRAIAAARKPEEGAS